MPSTKGALHEDTSRVEKWCTRDSTAHLRNIAGKFQLTVPQMHNTNKEPFTPLIVCLFSTK